MTADVRVSAITDKIVVLDGQVLVVDFLPVTQDGSYKLSVIRHSEGKPSIVWDEIVCDGSGMSLSVRVNPAANNLPTKGKF